MNSTKLRKLTTPAFFSGFAFAFLLFGAFLFVTLSQQPQDNRSRASTVGSLIAQGTLPSDLNGGPGKVTVNNLTPGATYKIVIAGTFYYRKNVSGFSDLLGDAQWGDDGTVQNGPVGCYCHRSYQPRFNGAVLDAIDAGTSYNPNHIYTFLWTANSSQLEMYIADTQYTGNVGSLSFNMYLHSLAPTNTPTPTPASTITPTVTSTPTSGITVTPQPNSTLLAVELLLHGIGKGGDNVSAQSIGNSNPLRTQRTVKVEVFNAQNNLVEAKSGQVIYASGSGSFKGTIDLGTALLNGLYTVTVKVDQYLNTLVPGIQTFTAGTANVAPATRLIVGDVNNDNKVNILDYNLLMGCYSDFMPANDCDAQKKPMADLNDDGDVNQFDYNLFLREISSLSGQ